MQPRRWGAALFATGLWITLSRVTMRLFVNLVLGTSSRVASQMGVFAIGLPITLGMGMPGLVPTLPMPQQPFLMLSRLLDPFR